MNNENGLPHEAQQFMDKHIHTEPLRSLFLSIYGELHSEQRAKAASEALKFMEKHLETDEDRALFLRTYAQLQSEQERTTFRAMMKDIPTDAEDEAAIKLQEQLNKDLDRNQSN